MATSQSPSDSELDQRVIDAQCDDDVPADPSNAKSWTSSQLKDLLAAIVEHSDGRLDQKYSIIGEARKALIAREGLRDSLIAAWNKKSFADIRNLDFLQARQSQSETRETETGSKTDIGLLRRLAHSFQAKYYGVAVDGFYEYLTENESSFQNPLGIEYYAKFCSIVQSSGTGKSRIFTQLHKKDVIVIYMNLRPMDDKNSFPARDRIPSQILTPPSLPDEFTYKTVCCAFFTALFNTLAEYLSPAKKRDDIMHWVGQMCDLTQLPKHPVRDAFFDKLEKNYQTTYAEWGGNPRAHLKDARGASSHSKTVAVAGSGTDIGKTAEQFEKLTISDSNTDFSSYVHSPMEKVAECLKRIFPDPADKNKPKLVIEFDEAHPLTEGIAYRPADCLCRVVSTYSHAGTKGAESAVWVVFASTTSKVAHFSPPNHRYNSDRVSIEGQKLFPPYTQLGWDQNAWEIDGTPIGDISKLDYILGFGRPLWLSLKNPLSHPSAMLRTANYKLLGMKNLLEPEKTGHVLAVLGQRFGLDVSFGHPDSVAHLEEGVASHLRICLATTPDRSWRFTSYPSEPLLSCVAANALHQYPGDLDKSLMTLFKVVQSGMVNIGQRGELASRLLWLLAKDLYIRTKAKDLGNGKPMNWDDHMRDCVMIPVVDWLEFVFGPQAWQTEGARAAFENACINFSHWVNMDVNIRVSAEGKELSLYEFTRRHWYRTSAVQCCHLQPLIDKMIPIYFKSDLDSTGTAKHQLSQILISDKAGQSRKSTKSDLSSITRTHASIGGNSDLGDALPYIAILADFAQPPGFSVTFPQRAVGDRALRIHAKGINAETYPFLAEYPVVEKVLRDLVQLQQSPEITEPVRKYLDTQVKFGATANPKNMLWERGKESPDASG